MAGVLDPSKLVFVDECGTHTSLAPLYGYSPKGERLRLSVPRNRGKNTTLLASITLEGMGPSMAVEGSTTKEVFEAYLEQVLLPQVREGQVLIMDKLPAHKPNRLRELIEARGCELCCTCPATPRSTTPSKRRSPRSRRSYAGRVPGLARPCSKRWAKRYPRSACGMPGDSSSTPVTILQVNYYETCCKAEFR